MKKLFIASAIAMTMAVGSAITANQLAEGRCYQRDL